MITGSALSTLTCSSAETSRGVISLSAGSPVLSTRSSSSSLVTGRRVVRARVPTAAWLLHSFCFPWLWWSLSWLSSASSSSLLHLCQYSSSWSCLSYSSLNVAGKSFPTKFLNILSQKRIYLFSYLTKFALFAGLEAVRTWWKFLTTMLITLIRDQVSRMLGPEEKSSCWLTRWNSTLLESMLTLLCLTSMRLEPMSEQVTIISYSSNHGDTRPDLVCIYIVTI